MCLIHVSKTIFGLVGAYDLHNSIVQEIIFLSPYSQFSEVPIVPPRIGRFVP